MMMNHSSVAKINEKSVEWVDVNLWEAEHKDETKPRLGGRLYMRTLGTAEADHQDFAWAETPRKLCRGQHHHGAQKQILREHS